jgi:uncharacterized protein YecT (DUF1311 family)
MHAIKALLFVATALLCGLAAADGNDFLKGYKEYGEAEYNADVARIEAEEATCNVLSESSVLGQCGLTFFHDVDVRECVKKKAAESEQALKDAEKALLEKLPHWDEDDKYINVARKAIALEGKTFIKYRKDRCALSASMAGGSFGTSIRRDGCLAELNNRRAKQLRDFIADLPLKEPQPPQ